MNNNLLKYISWLLYVLMGISAIMGILFYLGTISEEPFLIWAYILVGIAALASILFPIAFFIMNPKKAIGTLIGIGFLGILVLIGYLLASDQVMDITGYTGHDNVPVTLKWTETGIIATYLLAAIAFGSIIVTEIANFFK